MKAVQQEETPAEATGRLESAERARAMKAEVYDLLAARQQIDMRIAELNQAIAAASQSPAQG